MKVLIIEDETAAAQNLQAILREIDPSIQVLEVLESIEESADWLRNNPQPDLLFMDIHLADGESFRILDRVDITAPVIFTTAYDQYALEAFRLCSIDYLLKPIAVDDVKRALEKLQRLTGNERTSYTPRIKQAVKEYEETFLIHQRDKIIPLHRDQIAFCYTANERVMAYDFQGESYPIDRTLETLQAQLPASDFFRANRQFIIARRAVQEITVWFGSRLSLALTVETPERIIISKARVPEFKAWLRSVRASE
ncbi:MAG: response regulator transcription factor [Rikenellaceae bacterium]|nr:response regulator transcription factor [Rikenellaceae bacterium]